MPVRPVGVLFTVPLGANGLEVGSGRLTAEGPALGALPEVGGMAQWIGTQFKQE